MPSERRATFLCADLMCRLELLRRQPLREIRRSVLRDSQALRRCLCMRADVLADVHDDVLRHSNEDVLTHKDCHFHAVNLIVCVTDAIVVAVSVGVTERNHVSHVRRDTLAKCGVDGS